MDINDARKISKTDCSRCNRLVDTDCTCLEVAQAISFIEGHDSREAEVKELKEAYKDLTGDNWDDVVAGRAK